MKMLAPHDGPDIAPVDSAGELHGATLWVVVCAAAALVAAALGALACWIARRRNSLAHKLGGKRGPDKALVFQPPRRATAVRSPGSATHYLRKSPSPTAPAPPAASSPPQATPQTPAANPATTPTGGNSPHSPLAPIEPTPLSKELADANATEKTKTTEPALWHLR